jgi:cytochrome c oxidase subunit 2
MSMSDRRDAGRRPNTEWVGGLMQLLRRLCAALTLIMMAPLVMPSGGAAFAQAPKPWEMAMQPAANEIKRRIIDLHDLVLVIITLTTIFVAALLVIVMVKFNAKANPVPSKTSHHTGLEIAWTVIPVLLLVIMSIPSFRLIYFQDRTPNPDLTIKVVAHQWFWEYGYPDNGDFSIESRYVHDEDLKKGQLRLLDVDNQMVVPVGKNIRILTSSPEVIHSFFVPSLGVQRYAIPGRTIETWFSVDKPGVYYGQCNQICGADHSRMPIAVHAVSEQEFKAWAEQTKKSANAETRPSPMSVAAR